MCKTDIMATEMVLMFVVGVYIGNDLKSLVNGTRQASQVRHRGCWHAWP